MTSASLAGEVVIVTGAGGTGGSRLGVAIATRLASEGARIIGTDIEEGAAEETARHIQEEGGRAVALNHDVTDDGSWSGVVDATLSAYGRVDMLVNNVGIAADSEYFDLPTWDQVMTTNTRSVFLGMRHAIPQMVTHGKGVVVNVSSIAGSIGIPGWHMAYGTSKAAVRQMTRAAAIEFAPSGVRVVAVAPGQLSRHALEPSDAESAPIPSIPLARHGRPHEVAATIAFLLSEEASYITGTEVTVDGGASAAWGGGH